MKFSITSVNQSRICLTHNLCSLFSVILQMWSEVIYTDIHFSQIEATMQGYILLPQLGNISRGKGLNAEQHLSNIFVF